VVSIQFGQQSIILAITYHDNALHLLVSLRIVNDCQACCGEPQAQNGQQAVKDDTGNVRLHHRRQNTEPRHGGSEEKDSDHCQMPYPRCASGRVDDAVGGEGEGPEAPYILAPGCFKWWTCRQVSWKVIGVPRLPFFNIVRRNHVVILASEINFWDESLVSRGRLFDELDVAHFSHILSTCILPVSVLRLDTMPSKVDDDGIQGPSFRCS
jgi:hypothetical protein